MGSALGWALPEHHGSTEQWAPGQHLRVGAAGALPGGADSEWSRGVRCHQDTALPSLTHEGGSSLLRARGGKDEELLEQFHFYFETHSSPSGSLPATPSRTDRFVTGSRVPEPPDRLLQDLSPACAPPQGALQSSQVSPGWQNSKKMRPQGSRAQDVQAGPSRAGWGQMLWQRLQKPLRGFAGAKRYFPREEANK